MNVEISSPLVDASDEEKCSTSNERAFGQPLDDDEFARRLTEAQRSVFSFARSLTRDTDHAADVTQDALLRAWSARRRFAAGTDFRAWLFTIAKNKFLSNCRRARTQREFVQQVDVEPRRIVEQQQAFVELREVSRALRSLPISQQQALLLVAAAGYHHHEAALICGCPENTMRSRLIRARTALGRNLQTAPRRKAKDTEQNPLDHFSERIAELVASA